MNPLMTRWKARAVIKAGLRQFLEIRDGLGRGVGPKLDDHVAFGGFNHGHFLGVRGALVAGGGRARVGVGGVGWP